jgi:hypothetical protein
MTWAEMTKKALQRKAIQMFLPLSSGTVIVAIAELEMRDAQHN